MDNEMVLFETKDKEIKLNVSIVDDTVWLTQEQMSSLFDTARSTIAYHINQIFKEGELNRETSVEIFDRSTNNAYGLVLYKEQVMQIFEELGGFSREQSDFARRDASKKKLSALSEIKDDFVNGNKEKDIPGCRANGLEENTAKQIFEKVCAAAPYSFTRLHGVACAVLVYQMVWLKVHYESEFDRVKAKIS